jgi:transcription initiation factor TFIID subunit 6
VIVIHFFIVHKLFNPRRMASELEVLAICEELGVTLAASTDTSSVAREAELFLTSLLELSNRIRKHKKQWRLRVCDLNETLSAKGFPPVLGYRPSDSPSLARVGSSDGLDLLSVPERCVRLSSFRGAGLKPYPIDSTFEFHWLAIEGVQPQIEQNSVERGAGFAAEPRLRGPPPPLHFSDSPIVLISLKTLVPQHLQAYFLRALEVLRKQGGGGPEYKLLIEQLSADAAVSRSFRSLCRPRGS